MAQRKATLTRKTNETDIRVELNLDGQGRYTLNTGVGFFDHMLAHLSKHSRIDVKVEAKGDLEVDAHHTIEDVGIALGEALESALGRTLQGTAAEILVDEVRRVICPRKCDTATWLCVIREAHAMGIRSTATIMYGAGETVADRVRHLALLREVQDEYGGFTELVPLTFIHQNTPLYRAGRAPPGATGREDLLLIAVARLFLDNFDHVQVSWGKVGPKMASLLLLAGGDDLGGTMFEDEVTVEAGAGEASYMDPATMARIAADLGRTLWQRSTTYDLLREEPSP